MSRASRRAEQRKNNSSGRVTVSPSRSLVRDSDFDGLAPVPGPITTQLGPYKYGGKTWTLLTFGMENVTTHVVFAPEDARRFAEDVLKIVDGIERKGALTKEDIAEPSSSAGSGGIVIAKEMPHDI